MLIVKNKSVILLGLPRSLAIATAVVFVFIEFGSPLKLFVFLRLSQVWFYMAITNLLVTAGWLLIYRTTRKYVNETLLYSHLP